MGSILLGVPNSSYIEIQDETGYGYSFNERLNKKDIRTKGGDLYTYITPASTFNTWTIPMTYVSSSKVAQVNSWFRTATDLRFIEDDTFANSYYSVRIVGVRAPFSKFDLPYFRTYYAGEIVIETI
jgi:hypothetical protein